jgi:hypothetical protein
MEKAIYRIIKNQYYYIKYYKKQKCYPHFVDSIKKMGYFKLKLLFFYFELFYLFDFASQNIAERY